LLRVDPLLGREFRERQALTTSRARPEQNDSIHAVRMVERHLLGDHAAQRKTHHIRALQAQGIAEG
jgi:hypothetical protein